MQHDPCNSQAVHGNGRTSILKELACAWRHSIKHDKRGLVRKLQQLGRRSDGTKVEDTRSARDQHQIGRSNRCYGRRFRMWGGIDHGEFRTTLLCRL